jgi:hypothetical protein
MAHVVNVALTVDLDDLDRPAGLIRRELAAKLPTEAHTWQVTSVRRATRLDEHGAPAE